MTVLRAGAVRTARANVLLAALYFIAAWLSMQLALPSGYGSPLWLPAGIALTALWSFGPRLWPGVLVGSFLANLLVALDGTGAVPARAGALLALALGCGAAAQALIATLVLRRTLGQRRALLETPDVARFLLIGGPVCCLIASSWAVLWLTIAGVSDSPRDAAISWLTWWAGDTVGVLAIAPIALSLVGAPRELWRPRQRTVAVPLAVLAIGYAWLFSAVSTQERDALARDYRSRAEVAGDAVERSLVRYLEVLRSVEGFAARVGGVSRDEFRQFVARALSRVAGVQALSWNPLVESSARDRFESSARREPGLQDFRIVERAADGTLVPAGERDRYVVVRYIEPLAQNRSALGFDVASDSTRRAALERARDLGQPVTTAPIALLQETSTQAGVLVFQPVYRGGAPPDDLEDRRRALLGYAVGVFRLGDVLASALEGAAPANVVARLVDRTGGGAKALASVTFDASNRARLGQPGTDRTPGGIRFEWSRVYRFGGHDWALSIVATEPAPWPGIGTWLVTFGGLALIGLVGALLLSVSGRAVLDARRAQKLEAANVSLRLEAEHRRRVERALHEEKERVEVTLLSIGDAVITTDAAGQVTFVNRVAEALTGWPLREAAGRPLDEVFKVVDENTREPVPDPVEQCIRQNRIVTLTGHNALVGRGGREYPIDDSAAPIRDREGRILGAVLVFNDATESRRRAREAAHQASHDPLTGLVNRREFERRLDKAANGARRYGSRHALCFIDLDQFKDVNDIAGHRAGDELLKRLSTTLVSQLRERDTLARIGGDEFALLLDSCPPEKATEIASELVRQVGAFRFEWEGSEFKVGASIGLVAIGGGCADPAELLRQADVACYAAKALGRSRVHVYAGEADAVPEPPVGSSAQAADSGPTLDFDRFRLYYQPVFCLWGPVPRVEHREVLLRVLDAKQRPHVPEAFIAAAERYGLMARVDRWVVATVLRNHARFVDGIPDGQVAINLSGSSLADPTLLDFITSELHANSVLPSRVCFEITETAAIRRIDAAANLIAALRALGCHFALDDFGTGLSSFSYLKNLPVDYLKIDASFVHGIAHERTDRAIVAAIKEVAHELGLRTIAEGAESEEAVAELHRIGVDYAQGSVLGPPVPADGIENAAPSCASPLAQSG